MGAGGGTPTACAVDEVRTTGPGTVGTRAEPDGPEAGAAALGYRPALDGIRAVALGGVLLFHNGYVDVRGGFLGVSTFFTLSGFLIATVTLTEWAGTGRVSPARFYERRARRLLPAALLTFGGVVVLRAFTDVGSGSGFRTDVLAALGYAANWRFAVTGDDYATLFAQPSPVLHFWSLAIEEQFYLAFPLLFVAIMTLARRFGPARRGAEAGNGGTPSPRPGDAALIMAGGFFALLAGGSFALASLLSESNGNDGATYYGTHTRAGELLAGVALAYLVRSAWFRQVVATRRVTVALGLAGPAALAGLAFVWHEASLSGARLFQGVTLLNAGLTCVLIVAALHRGPAATALGLWPVRSLGKISYAAYLFHWPVFLWLTDPRVHLGPHRLFLLRILTTFALATASYHLLEAPFRFRLRMPRRRLAAGLTAAGALTAALVVVAPQGPAADGSFTAGIAGTGNAGNAEAGPKYPFLRMHGVVKPVDGRDPVARILIAGDSMPVSLIVGLETWNENHPDRQIWVDSHTAFGCPLVDTGVSPMEVAWPTLPECVEWHHDLSEALVKWDDDVVFLNMGLTDLQGHRIDGEMIDIGDPVHDRWFVDEVARMADTLTEPGMPVVWATFPHVRFESSWEPTKTWEEFPINQPWRVERYNELVLSVIADRPGIDVVDLDAWVRGWPDPFDPELRDGVHFLDESSPLVAEWLVPQILAVAPARPSGPIHGRPTGVHSMTTGRRRCRWGGTLGVG